MSWRTAGAALTAARHMPVHPRIALSALNRHHAVHAACVSAGRGPCSQNLGSYCHWAGSEGLQTANCKQKPCAGRLTVLVRASVYRSLQQVLSCCHRGNERTDAICAHPPAPRRSLLAGALHYSARAMGAANSTPSAPEGAPQGLQSPPGEPGRAVRDARRWRQQRLALGRRSRGGVPG